MAPRSTSNGFIEKESENSGFQPETWIPTGRSATLKNAKQWLRFKRIDDKIDPKLWRIHDDLYDLTSFAKNHPGGQQWIDLTQGTDITEAFEVFHVMKNDKKMDEILKKYHVKSCKNIPRRYDFTFDSDGFYQTLKRRVQKVLQVHGTGPTREMLHVQDGLALAFVALLALTALTESFWVVATLTGVVLGMTITTAHNFFHQKDNLRFSSY